MVVKILLCVAMGFLRWSRLLLVSFYGISSGIRLAG